MTREDARRVVNGWLSELGALSLDEDGSCIVEQEDHKLLIGLQLAPTSPTLLFQAQLLPVSESETGLLVAALEANLYQVKTGGGAIALDTVSSDLIFCHQYTLRDDSTQNEFMSFLESFIGLSVALRSILSVEKEPAEESSEGPASEFLKI